MGTEGKYNSIILKLFSLVAVVLLAFISISAFSTKMVQAATLSNSFQYSNANGWWSTTGYNASQITDTVVSGDFNGDGKTEIAAFYDYGNFQTSIHVWNSTGNSFQYSNANGWWSTTGYDAKKIKGRVVAGDFNGDGKCDIAALYDYGNGQTRIHVWISTGNSFQYSNANGWWSTTGYDCNKVTDRIVAGDFNGDGKADIAAFYDYGNSETRLHVWISTGSSFQYPSSNGWWNTTGYNASQITGRVVAGDFNGDGKTDIGAFYDYGNSETRLHVWTSNGNSFQYSNGNGWWNTTGYNASQITNRVVAGDFSGDGKCDIAAFYDYGNSEIRIHVWTSSGSSFQYAGANGWWSTTGYNASQISGRVVAGDFNSNKIADIAAFYDYGNSETRIHVWLSNTTVATYTGNGHALTLPDDVYGNINGREVVLNPNNHWSAYEYSSKQGETGKTDDGKYKIAVGPKILNANYPDNGGILASDFNGLNKNIDVVLVNKTTGGTLILHCYVTDLKAHTYNKYNGGGNNVSFNIESGLIQTGIAYPNSWNYSHETPFSESNCDASVIEFIIKPTDFNPSDYKLCMVITYN